MFELESCKVRLARENDRDDLIRISKGIWDGHDYLPRLLDRWINEPYFFVCEYDGTAIACLKLSLFPDHVLWFEGLRVHRKYQGKGIATMMNRHLFAFARELKQADPRLSYEFCTYYKNVESLHLTQKLGFRPVERFYSLDRRGIVRTMEPEIVKDFGMEEFTNLKKYIPLGWQPVHNVPDSLDFIKSRALLFRTPQASYLLGGITEQNILFLAPPVQDIKAELPYFQHFFGSRKRFSILLPLQYKTHLPRLMQEKFFFWDDTREVAENYLILSM